MFVRQPVDKPKLLWPEMLDLGERLAQGLMRDGWAVKVTTVSSSFVIYSFGIGDLGLAYTSESVYIT